MTNCRDSKIRIIDLESGMAIKIYEAPDSYSNREAWGDTCPAVFSPREVLIMVPSSNGRIIAFDIADASVIDDAIINQERGSKFCEFAWQPADAGGKLAAISSRGTLTIWA